MRTGRARSTVVVADDDPMLCDFIAMALAELGYEILTAANGAEALALVERERPVLVLMDVGMPILSGRDLAARIQEVAGHGIPCILMSGDLPAPCAGDDAFVSAYLHKPFDLDTLIAAVERCTAEPATTV